MKWKRSLINYKTILLLSGFFFCCGTVYSENKDPFLQDNYPARRNPWTPAYIKMQYAGGMGVLSGGTGWSYGKNGKWETDVLIGFLPKFSTESFRMTFTLKQNFISPWQVALTDKSKLELFSGGIYVNTILNENYWMREPGKYPSGYYSFSTKVRVNIFVGQRFTWYYRKNQHSSGQKGITFFYEIGTNELYMISAFGNRYLKPKDYLKLSLGMKWDLF